MIAKITLLLLLNISLFGTEFDVFEFSFHGKFCGNNIPSLDFKTHEEEVKLLKKIPAIDSIDEACKQHDICYSQKGEHDLSCDNELVHSMEIIRKKLKEQNCKVLAKAIITYFDLVNYNPITVLESGSSLQDKIVEVPTSGMENMFDLASFSGDMMINYTYSKPVDYVFDAKNNKERIKDIFQLFPPRDKPCQMQE